MSDSENDLPSDEEEDDDYVPSGEEVQEEARETIGRGFHILKGDCSICSRTVSCNQLMLNMSHSHRRRNQMIPSRRTRKTRKEIPVKSDGWVRGKAPD